MRRSVRFAMMSLVFPLVLFGGHDQAHAAAAGVVQGGGGISPGLGLIPVAQVFNFTGTVTTALVTQPVHATGIDLIGTIGERVGFITLTAPCQASGVFTRVGATVDVVLTSGGGGKFVFVPDQVGTFVTSYTLTGVGLCT